MTDIPELARAVPETEAWIGDLTQRLGWHDRHKVYLALLATLHGLRDSLPRHEAVYIGSYLPSLLRGFYYEGWHPTGRAPVKNRGAFLERVHEGIHREPGIDPEQVARAVFGLLAARLPAAELENAKAVTPKPLHALWPA